MDDSVTLAGLLAAASQAVTSTAAQFFIYYTLDNFGSVIFSMVR